MLIYITGKCHKIEDVSDIFQETYMELLLVLEKKDWEEIQNEEAFLIKLAKRKIYRHYSFLEKLENLITRKIEEETVHDVEHINLMLSPEHKVIRQSMIDQAHRYLKTKDELTKKIFYLYYYDEVTIAQIAKMLSVGESTVKNRLYRTLKEMRLYFNETQ